MKLIIAGSRTFNDYALLTKSVAEFLCELNDPFPTIVSGTASGADKLGEKYAKERGLNLICMPADWNTHGKSAGYKRNEAMALISGACIVFWDGTSRGTQHMINLANEYYLKLKIIKY